MVLNFEAIRELPNRFSLYRYVTLMIELSDLPKIEKPHCNIFTNESRETIDQFILEIVREYNATHPDTVTENDVIEAIAAMWKRDIMDMTRESVIPV